MKKSKFPTVDLTQIKDRLWGLIPSRCMYISKTSPGLEAAISQLLDFSRIFMNV